MGNIIKVNFDPDKYFIWGIQGLEQWDQGQKLEISGLDISDEIVEVHFSLDEVGGNAKRMLGVVNGGVIHADIPAFILEGPEHIFCNNDTYSAYAWIYVSDDESAETIRKMEFTIKARPKPEEYVKPEEPDTFIGQIKKIMNETKKIAQSVRDDADNGEFDGEQGPKGDAGSIEFKIVNELPTENISESTMYLVPLSPGTEQNEFAEYIYANGHWEYIGSASVEVDLSEYVKNTDYATGSTAGIVKPVLGLTVGANGIVYIAQASESQIDAKTDGYFPITSQRLDYAVMKALSDSKLEWTDEQKQLARELLGSVGSEDYATADKVGLVRAVRSGGITIDSRGVLSLDSASRGEINAKQNYRNPIMPSNIDYAVKKALSDCKLTGDDVWTEEEKSKALELLGGVDKKYVDDLVGSVESILTELHAHAESLIGGEA